jgi:hypothetical protein
MIDTMADGALTCFITINCTNFHPIQQQLGSPDPKRQPGDSILIEAKQNVENTEGSPGDTEDNVKSEEGEANGPLGSPGDIGSTGPQEAVGRGDNFGPQGDTTVRPSLHCFGS